ncbi:MAG: SET domain-containing protein [Methanoregula sp.]|nr:SET domain-containing protein [Methanoregula sp.]
MRSIPREVEMNKYPVQAFSQPPTGTCALRDTTDELSFVLRPSRHDGVGVFSTHGIRRGTRLRLFPGPASRFVPAENESDGSLLDLFSRRFGIHGRNGYYVPHDFGCMEIGWYLNHSPDPNAYHDEVFDYFASRDIPAGEEITVDYQTLRV